MTPAGGIGRYGNLEVGGLAASLAIAGMDAKYRVSNTLGTSGSRARGLGRQAYQLALRAQPRSHMRAWTRIDLAIGPRYIALWAR